MMRVGGSTIPLAPLSGEEALRTLASLGFKTVDIAAVPTFADHVLLHNPPPDQPERLAGILQDLGLKVNGIAANPWLPDALDDLDEMRKRFMHAARVAQAAAARIVIVDGGQQHPAGRDEAIRRFQGIIRMEQEIATEFGLTLGIEAPHMGTLAEHHDEVAEILEAAADVGADVALAFDTSHVHNSGESIDGFLTKHATRIAHIAVRDTTGPGVWDMPLGEGDIDFEAVVRGLAENNIQGDLMLELEPGAGTIEQRISLIERGRAFLEHLITGTGL